jgi:triacylglycerol esterase/lipase EstA (alpha/beta hydrolase family)
VNHVPDLTYLEDITQNKSRVDKISEFTRDRNVWNKKIMNMPQFFIENYQKKDRRSVSSRKKISSLTVFVHGYQGNSFDFQKAKNYLKENNKYTHVLIIESITNEMNQSIEYLGKEAAD